MINPTRLQLRPRFFAAFLERVFGLRTLSEIYEQRPLGVNPKDFLSYVIDALGVSNTLKQEENLLEIPKEGPLLIVANHPLGGLEGIVLANELLKYRPDLKVLTNELLRRIPEFKELFVGVDILSQRASKSNFAGIKQIHSHLKYGGAVLIFPAGMVATYERDYGRVQDGPWKRLVGQLIKRYQCVTLPIHVGGRNSTVFYAAGMIHPRLRTILLPRQLSNKNGFNLTLTIGRIIPSEEIRLVSDPQAITDYLRVSTDALEQLSLSVSKKMTHTIKPSPVNNSLQLEKEIEDLKEFRLIEHDEFDVYCAPYDRLGLVIEQIAISREITFRDVGEGTGFSKDSDEFDSHYLHLFLWDKINLKIAGAYRVGFVDEIVSTHGVEGLYSRSLYRYGDSFIKKLGAAIEMGRSFIHPDYQRRPVSLNLLWRGIGRILVSNPKYHTLFGSVSVSREYSDLARSLIVDVLLSNFKAREFSDLVEPLTPHKIKNRVWTERMLSELANVKSLGKLIGRCDPGKSLPVLLRHYLALAGKIACFNVHANFNDSLEGLIIVDARITAPKTLKRFMGAEGHQRFMQIHKLQG
ncbi:MAG: GNAT family N-acyltransferase [Gammaproteobacteria bacterium]|nr:GNAT family N-acyltransferase [Gammaproteobacteria bacterium]